MTGPKPATIGDALWKAAVVVHCGKHNVPANYGGWQTNRKMAAWARRLGWCTQHDKRPRHAIGTIFEERVFDLFRQNGFAAVQTLVETVCVP